MKIVYYYVLYLRRNKKPEEIEIHMRPFSTEAKAKECAAHFDKEFGKRVYYSGIKKVNLSKYEKEIWVK